MRAQFIRIYLLMIAIVCLLLYSFNAIYEQVNDSEQQYELSINQLFSSFYLDGQQPLIYSLPLNSIALPEPLAKQLARGEIIPLELQSGYWTYYQKKDDSILAYGPVAEARIDNNLKHYFLIFFYSALALLFLALLKPLFSDLYALQKAAKKFGEKPQAIHLNISHGSSIFPLVTSFQKMSRQIVDLLTMNRDLSRTISHELRTPLTRMRFVIEALSGQIDMKYQKRMEDDIEEIDQLITAYLNFAKLENTEQIFQKRRRNIGPLMKKITEKYELYQEDISIIFNYQNIPCSFDAQHLSIAVQNLINNAMRYAQTKIQVDLYQQNKMCVMTISDDGPGLADDKLELFDAFVRKKNTQSDKGFGLGLYIARRVAILHAGDLRVDNDPELGGARFTLIWPNEKI